MFVVLSNRFHFSLFLSVDVYWILYLFHHLFHLAISAFPERCFEQVSRVRSESVSDTSGISSGGEFVVVLKTTR